MKKYIKDKGWLILAIVAGAILALFAYEILINLP